MEMIDSNQRDEKIIAVAEGDMSVSHYNDITELPENFMQELKHFFLNYKTLSRKEVRVDNFKGQSEALEIIKQSVTNYNAKFV